uniref:Ankyrin repeat protein n=1 Tax=Timema douglasi TaxID=61478 RepID=A0A7R8ZB05_TIMDO|nr:unnamed protein product [Timema douglasi]
MISDASEYYENLSREDLLNHLKRETCLRHQLEQELKEREQFIQELQQRILELRPKQQASVEIANTPTCTEEQFYELAKCGRQSAVSSRISLFFFFYGCSSALALGDEPWASLQPNVRQCCDVLWSGFLLRRVNWGQGGESSDSVLNVQHTYNKSAGFADMSGEWYEIKMATLLFLRGLNYTEDFFLATNFDGADRHFTGIPLQTLLLAEVFENDLRVYQESKQFNFHEECDLFLLYDRFVEKKWDVYLSEKKKEDTSNIGVQRDNEDLKNIFMSNHMIAALLRILSPKDLSVLKYKDLQVKGSRFIGRVEQGYDHTGIILGITDGVPRFVHHTFAEYFTAKWFAMNFSENRNFVEHNFWESSYEVVKSIFDRILANDSDLHIAVLRNDVAAVTGLLEKGAEVNFRDMGGRSALHLAAVQKNGEDVIKILLKHGADIHLADEVLQWTGLRYADKGINSKDKQGKTPLFIASEHNHLEVVKYLTEKGADVEICSRDGYSPLYIALLKGNTNVIHFLKDVATVDKGSKNGWTLMHTASTNGHLNVIEHLLKINANINACNKYGQTPLHIAAKKNNVKVLQFLIQEGALVNFHDKTFGWTPLNYAIQEGYLDIVEHLLNAGAELDVCEKNNMAQSESDDQVGMVHHLTDMETGLIIPNKMNSWTPLFLASWYGHLDIVKVLTVKGAQLDVCEKTSGRSALHIAAEKNHISVAEHLIEKGADINIRGQLGGLTPLHVASQRGNVEMVMLLIEKGAHMEIQDRINGQTPLHNAAWCCHFELAKCLINKGANINATDGSGWTPMHIAAEKNHLDMVQLLVEYGANINTRTNTYDWTPLHYAAKYGRSEIVEFLIKNNAELEVHDAMRGQIALHIAAENSHLHVIKQLVEGGTSVQVRDSNGMTALDIALAQNDKLMVEFLKPLTDPIIPRT